MALTRWDKEPEKKKNSEKDEEMSLSEMVADLAKKNPFPKTPTKRRREEAKEEEEPTGKEKRLDWLKERAKKATIPTEQVSTLKPEHIFMEAGPLIIHVCYECRKFNADRPTSNLGEGRVQLPLALCTVCRAHFNHQRTIKFFEHELPSIKKSYNL